MCGYISHECVSLGVEDWRIVCVCVFAKAHKCVCICICVCGFFVVWSDVWRVNAIGFILGGLGLFIAC